jgi:hypothetical protein
MRGFLKMHFGWKLWIFLMAIVNGILPLFFIDQAVALITFSGAIAGLFIGFTLAFTQGYTKLLGLMHGPWIPAFVLQIYTLMHIQPAGYFGAWLWTSTIITGSSLALDTMDVYFYIKGHRHRTD